MIVTAVLLGLTLTVTPAKPEFTLGEPVELKVELKNEGKEEFPLSRHIELGDHSVSLTIGEGAQQWVYQRKVAGYAKVKASLKPGESDKGAVSWTPVRAGEYPIEAHYQGEASGTTKVTVKPAKDGATELGVLMSTTVGDLKIRFFPEVAPNHVAHFAERVRTGFYKGTPFHRIIQTFMAQGGDPTGTGGGGPGYSIPAEFSNDPKYSHTFGRVSTARTNDPDSAGSQFFLCFDQATFLDGKYTVLGEVCEGHDVLKKLEAAGLPQGVNNGMLQKEKQPHITSASLVPLKKS